MRTLNDCPMDPLGTTGMIVPWTLLVQLVPLFYSFFLPALSSSLFFRPLAPEYLCFFFPFLFSFHSTPQFPFHRASTWPLKCRVEYLRKAPPPPPRDPLHVKQEVEVSKKRTDENVSRGHPFLRLVLWVSQASFGGYVYAACIFHEHPTNG